MCRLCRQDPCDYRCPNYIPPKATCYCSICGNGIYPGEEYLKNDNEEYSHYDCFYNIRDLVEWLGHEIKIMEE